MSAGERVMVILLWVLPRLAVVLKHAFALLLFGYGVSHIPRNRERSQLQCNCERSR